MPALPVLCMLDVVLMRFVITTASTVSRGEALFFPTVQCF